MYVCVVLFGLSAVTFAFGAYLLSELTTPSVALRVLLATGVLAAGIAAAYFVAFAVGTGVSEVLWLCARPRKAGDPHADPARFDGILERSTVGIVFPF